QIAFSPVSSLATTLAFSGTVPTSSDTATIAGYSIQTTISISQTGAPAPSVNPNGTVNNASFAPGTTPLAAGSIAAIFGTNLNDGSSNPSSALGTDGKLLTALGGTNVTFNGTSAPVFSSFSSQLNVEIPQELANATSASVQVTIGGQASPSQT